MVTFLEIVSKVLICIAPVPLKQVIEIELHLKGWKKNEIKLKFER